MTTALEENNVDTAMDANEVDSTPLTPEPGGIDTVTLESGGKSVTLTSEHFDAASDALADTIEPTINAEDTAILFKLRERLRECESQEASAAEAHKDAKKRTEAQQDELNRFIDELEQPRPPTLFDDAAKPESEESEDANAAPAALDDESWRKVTVKDLGISDAIADKLAANEPMLDTLGAIIDYTTAGRRLTDIAGIGAAKAEAIDEAITKYFADHPRPAPKRDESWRATMLSEIGITGDKAEAFWNYEPPMGTLGEIADWLDRDGNKLSNIGALEESTIKKVLNAIEKARQ